MFFVTNMPLVRGLGGQVMGLGSPVRGLKGSFRSDERSSGQVKGLV